MSLSIDKIPGLRSKLITLNNNSYVWDLPSRHGLLEWNYPALLGLNNTIAVSGTLYVFTLIPQVGGVITNIQLICGTSGSTLTAATSATVSGAANNGSGLIRLTATAHGFSTNDVVAVAAVGGTTEAVGAWVITVIDANTFDLVGSVFVHTYTSGGTAKRSPNVVAIYDSAGAFLGATVDQVTSFGSGAYKTCVLANPVTLTPGLVYYIAVLCIGTTPITFTRISTGTPLNANQTAAAQTFAVNGTGLTKLPSTITPASNSATGAIGAWIGLS